jgi:hypothetical protein
MTATVVTTTRDGLLRLALRADAAISAVAGVPLLLAGGPLADELGPSSVLLRLFGAAFVVYGAVVWRLAARPAIPRGPVLAVIVGNALGAILVIVDLVEGWLPLTTAGVVVAVGLALHTTVFADLQFLGLRRAGRR